MWARTAVTAAVSRAVSRGCGVPLSTATATAAASAGGPMMVDYASYLSPRATRLRPSPIRALMPYMSRPGMISLGGGLPNPISFPFAGASLTTVDGARLEFSAEDMKEGFQYTGTAGLPDLGKRLMSMQRGEHRPPLGLPLSILITSGSQHGLSSMFEMLLHDASAPLLVESPTYSGSLAYLHALGVPLVGIDTDGQGLVPAAMAAVLDGWDVARQGPKPRVLYTIPSGGNPTGASSPLERKQMVYAIARQHGILILEDDPYYYLQYAAKRTPSYLSMDLDGRVVRFDSFSKVLSAGIRVGTITGPAALVDRVNMHHQSSVLHPSGLSQVAVQKLFQLWGVGEGDAGGLGPVFERHLATVTDFYRQQCDSLIAAADKHLRVGEDGSGESLVSFARPSAGMFVWMRLHGVDDTFSLISKDAVEANVLMVPGTAFYHDGRPSSHVRASFSTATRADIHTAMQRLGGLLRARRKAVA